MKAIADAPGSPIVVLDREDFYKLNIELDEQALRIQELEEQIAEPRETVVSPVDVDALAGALVVKLDTHFAKRPGPKPRAA